tara:strand:+ start:3139 stop:3567 length:429 start_codon:yes stop_codon:yes gene_type:complete
MFSKDILIGVLLSLAKPEIHISRNNRAEIGYAVRLRVNVRGQIEFLRAVEHALAQQGIDCLVKEKEHKGRPHPILRISGIKNLYKTTMLLPGNYPDAKGEWNGFKMCVDIFGEGRHRTLEGLELIMAIKGIDNGTNKQGNKN